MFSLVPNVFDILTFTFNLQTFSSPKVHSEGKNDVSDKMLNGHQKKSMFFPYICHEKKLYIWSGNEELA